MTLPSFIVSIIGIVDSSDACDNPLFVYLLVSMLLGTINMAFAAFLFSSLRIAGHGQAVLLHTVVSVGGQECGGGSVRGGQFRRELPSHAAHTHAPLH